VLIRNDGTIGTARNFACGAANCLAARWFNFACGANNPYQALKGGYFVFVWRVLT